MRSGSRLVTVSTSRYAVIKAPDSLSIAMVVDS